MDEIKSFFPEEIQEYLYYYLFISLAIRTVIWLLFAYTIRKTILLMKPENLFILPNQVWYVAIPLFNIYWNFEVVRRFSDSLNNECFDRKIAVEDRPGMRLGLLYAWTFLAVNIPFPASILVIVSILQLFYFVSYWVKISRFKTLLIEHNKFLEEETNKIDENN